MKQKLTYSLWDVLLASTTQPISEEKRQRQLTRMYIALDQIEKGDNPTVDDLALVSDAVELTNRFHGEWVTTFGIDDELMGIISEARESLLNSYSRYQNGANIRLTGKGMQSVRDVMHHYYLLINSMPERNVLQLHRATELANIKSLKEGNAVILKGTVS